MFYHVSHQTVSKKHGLTKKIIDSTHKNSPQRDGSKQPRRENLVKSATTVSSVGSFYILSKVSTKGIGAFMVAEIDEEECNKEIMSLIARREMSYLSHVSGLVSDSKSCYLKDPDK